MQNILVPLALCLSTALLPSMTRAETPGYINGGLICDTLEDAISYIQGEEAPTCGTLVIPTLAVVIELAPFEHDGLIFLMTQYDFLEPVSWGVQTQYGFWGAPQPAPASFVPDELL